jgi:hypothetical protein
VTRALVLSFLSLVAVACNRQPAAESIQAAEQALAAAPEIQTYLPEDFAALSEVLREARASLDAGRYTDALRAAQVLPDRIAAAAAAAAKRKEQLAAAWSALSADLPTQQEALAARLAALASAGAISSERLLAAQAELASLNQAWAETTAAFERGDIAAAVAAGQDVKAKGESLAGRLGRKPAPATAPTPAPTPAP